jgi:5-methylcytosine-specific restriction protein A
LHLVQARTESESRRGSAHERGYSAAWRKARWHFLRAHPLCAEHQRSGQLVAASVVDHIVPHRGDKDRFWMRSNWQPLCKPCHDSKTARENGGFGNDRQ